MPVLALASKPDWKHIIFVGPANVRQSIQLKDHMRYIEVDEKRSVLDVSQNIQQELGTIFGEVGLNLFSGSGALHMATLSAILKCGGGIRLVHFENELVEL